MTTPAPTRLLSLHLGRIRAFGPRGEPSAIDKQPHAGAARIGPLGLEADAQADRRHHGGPDKALHHYPREHYAPWCAELPGQAALFVPGGFGENLSTLGLTEATVCVGDVFGLGNAVLQVSQGRKPCWKLNTRFGVEDMARRVQDTGRTGWYYRVLQAGEVTAGDALALLERPCPEWPLARAWRLLYQAPPLPEDQDALAELAELPQLAQGWRDTARKRARGEEAETWGQRLERMFRG
ncbi:MAG: MOSC domain-containing protein [Pseudomonadota bacterium]